MVAAAYPRPLTRQRTGRGCYRRIVPAHPPSGGDRRNAPSADRVYAVGRAILRAPGILSPRKMIRRLVPVSYGAVSSAA